MQLKGWLSDILYEAILDLIAILLVIKDTFKAKHTHTHTHTHTHAYSLFVYLDSGSPIRQLKKTSYTFLWHAKIGLSILITLYGLYDTLIIKKFLDLFVE